MSNQQFAGSEQQSQAPQSDNTDPGANIQRSRPRGLWFWIVIALVILAVIGAGVDAVFATFQNTTTETHTYSVSTNTPPTLVINDDTGSVTIQRGNTNSQVTIAAIKHLRAFGIGALPTVRYSQSGSTLTASAHTNDTFFGFGSNNVDFEVTIPAAANLHIHTGTGSVNVSGISGTMLLTSDTGSIDAAQVSLSGHSVLMTGTGSINFLGSLDFTGLYQFSTGTGLINITLPAYSAFHLNATTRTGSFNNDFSSLNVQPTNTIGSEALGNVGVSPAASVVLKTNTGSIVLHKKR